LPTGIEPAHELVDPEVLAHHTWHEIGSLAALPDLLAELDASGA
jgi:hypothetical protein